MSERPLSPWSLERLGIDSFGRLADRSVGPFAPGMNVVFGKNESGKSTIASFVSGVLFGWPDGRSHQNTYKPVNAERSGRLVFRSDGGGQAVLSRARNADGVDDAEGLLGDIDASTYRTVFALDNDELLSLDDAGELTSHLLTAGSGTAVSPMKALADLDGRIAGYTSRAASADYSIVNLSAQLDEVEGRLARAREEARGLIAESAEYQRLEPARERLAREHDEVNALIEGRSADLSLLHQLQAQVADQEGQRADLESRLAALEAEAHRASEGVAGDADLAALRDLNPSEERAIRDTLADFQVERERLMNAVDHAKRNLTDSTAAYQVLEESARSGQDGRSPSRALGQVAMSIILPAIALLAGVPTVIYGREIASLSITTFGVFLVLAALIMGAAALVVALRPDTSGLTLEQRLEDARWVMLQDQKKMQACEAELTEMGERIASYLHFNHLSAAGRSLRRAHSMLDEARDLRASDDVLGQRKQAILAQADMADAALARTRAQRDELLDDAHVADIAAFESLINDALERRRQLMAEAERMDTRYGELAQRLAQALDDRGFAELKQERVALRHRLHESKRDYACLLLARRNLSQAVAAWEAKSQPEVYRLASRLFAEMTDGAWSQVRLTVGGQVQVVNGQGEARDPMLLSLGTRQQLYLALRIALLMVAQDVGRAVPVLADDILVNFDADRRRAAARALLELSRMRQVLLFTCHEEVLDLLRGLDGDVNVVSL